MAGSTSSGPTLRVTTYLLKIGHKIEPRHGFRAAALLIAFAAAWPMLSDPGLLNSTRGGGDSPFLLQRLHQLEAALRGGHFPVRWMPDANYGYGFPFFNYYAPFSFYIAAVFRIIGFSYVRSLQLTQLAGFITAALGMFYLGKRWLGSRWAGLIASAAYTLAPFHLVNIYVRGDSLAEFWAMALYPLVVLAADDLIEEGPIAGAKIAWFALTYAGLILTHNISALIFTPFLLLYMALRWWFTARRPPVSTGRPLELRILPLLFGALLALALAAHFFLPALAERSLAQMAPVTAGHFFYGNHFQSVDLVQPDLLVNYDPAGSRAFHTGLFQALLAFIGVVILAWEWKRRSERADRRQSPQSSAVATTRSRYAFIGLAFVISTYMITPLSRPLWERLPLLAFAQFPWRFLSVQAIATSLASAGLAMLPQRRFIVPGAALLLLVSSLARLETAHLALTDADITAERLAQYEWFTGNIGSTVSAEYLPTTVQPRPYTSHWLTEGERAQIHSLTGNLVDARQLERRATYQSWQVTIAPDPDPLPATLAFPTMYWPGWIGMVDGERVAIRPAAGSGLITLDLPPGDHVIELRLGRTPIRLIAELISLASILIIFWLFRPLINRQLISAVFGVLMISVAVGASLRLWPDRKLSPGTLTWDFAQMGYLHHAPEGIVFDNGAVLGRYVYSQDSIAAGETLFVTLFWEINEANPASQVTLSLASPAVNRFEKAPLLVDQSQPFQSGEMTFRMAIPANAPTGLYVPRLRLDGSRALMSANRLRGDLFLRPIRIRDAQLLADDSRLDLNARAVRVQQKDAGTLEVQLAWLTQRPLSRNYNITLRLKDAGGRQLSQFDSQPGFGFQPSIGWPVGRWVNDWLALSLPDQLPNNFPYLLMTQLYDVETGAVVLTRLLGELNRDGNQLVFLESSPHFSWPDDMVPLTATFEAESAPIIQLGGYDLAQSEEQIELTLYWRALRDGHSDYTRFVHLIDPATGQPPVAQSDEMPRHNSYPTSQWVADEVVTDPLTLNVTDVPAGTYQLVVGLYRPLTENTTQRLPAVDGDGNLYPLERVPLPVTITLGSE